VLSLLTYRLLIFTPGCWFWYSVTRCANVLASAPVQPSQDLDRGAAATSAAVLSVPAGGQPEAERRERGDRGGQGEYAAGVSPCCPQLSGPPAADPVQTAKDGQVSDDQVTIKSGERPAAATTRGVASTPGTTKDA